MGMGLVEARFADIIWQHEPVASGELVSMSGKELGWKKSTTYTVLRRLCERGIFQNINGVVSSLISREDYYAMQSEQFVEENFGGSLPGFITAFTSRKKLTDKEIRELEELIHASRQVE